MGSCHYFNPPLEELWRRLHERNQRGSGGTIIISRANLEEWSTIFQAPDAAEFALFDRAAEIADARTFPI